MPIRPQNDAKIAANLPDASGIEWGEDSTEHATLTTWQKRDWRLFYEAARRPGKHMRPPRPVYPTGIHRVQPAAGFSLSELDDAGINLEVAERLGLPVDAGRIGAYGPNVSALRDFLLVSRQPR